MVDRAFQQQGHSPEAAATLFAEKLDFLKTKEEIMTVTQAIKQEGIQEGIQQGRQQGMQQGRQQGIQQGRQQGIQQGRQQGMQQEKLHIAKNMLSKLHLDIQAVKEATGLSEEEIMRLQEEAKR